MDRKTEIWLELKILEFFSTPQYASELSKDNEIATQIDDENIEFADLSRIYTDLNHRAYLARAGKGRGARYHITPMGVEYLTKMKHHYPG